MLFDYVKLYFYVDDPEQEEALFAKTFAVPKSASIKCQLSLNRIFPGFKSLCIMFLLRKKAKMFINYAT